MIARLKSLLPRTRLLVTLMILGGVSGCNFKGAIPKNKDGKPAPAKIEPPPSVPVNPPPAKLVGAPLARRLVLDFGLGLPSPADVDLLTADPKKLPQVLDALLNQGNLGRALAGLHPRMWHLDSKHLPELDRFVALGDQTLEAALTPALRQRIIEEPAELVRWVIDAGLPFHRLFEGTYSVAHPDLIDLWGLTDDGPVFPGEPWRFGLFADDRPSAGLLANNGFNASIGGRDDRSGRSRAGRLLGELLCLPLEKPQAHTFADLTAAELQQDLGTLAASRASCVGCHAHLEGPGTVLAGLGGGADLAAWLTYDDAAAATEGTYGGHPFTGLGGLASYVGSDPRAHRCEVKKLLEAVYQRPFGIYDGNTVNQALDAFYEQDYSLAHAARRLALASEYATGVVTSDIKGDYLLQSSGVRVLGKTQWAGIVQALAPSVTNSLVLTDDLDAGHDEYSTSAFGVPSGGYWHAVDRLTRQLATAIVTAELEDGKVAATRQVLQGLPDGAGVTSDTALIAEQLRATWRLLTGVTLADTDQTFIDLQALWSASNPDGSAEDNRRAWRTVLTGMLSHPSFLTY